MVDKFKKLEDISMEFGGGEEAYKIFLLRKIFELMKKQILGENMYQY